MDTTMPWWICNNKHEEICHEGFSCPICDLIAEKDQEIEELNDNVVDLRKEVEMLESKEHDDEQQA